MTKILVADDDVDMVESLSTLFVAMGHEARMAFDGVEALQVAKAFEPRIVFLDLAMPRLDGYQAAAAIRSSSGMHQPKLIALTASQGIDTQDAIKAAGFDSYMQKPIDTLTLISVVTDIASRS